MLERAERSFEVVRVRCDGGLVEEEAVESGSGRVIGARWRSDGSAERGE